MIECPICMEQIRPPVILCENGHHVCEVCRKLITKCEICRGQWSYNRCAVLDSYLKQIPFPCPNRVDGCQYILQSKDIKSHVEGLCIFRKYKCPLLNCMKRISSEDCTSIDFPSHMWDTHGITTHSMTHIDDENKVHHVQLNVTFRHNFLGLFCNDEFPDVYFFLHYRQNWNYYYIWVSYASVSRNEIITKFQSRIELYDYDYSLDIYRQLYCVTGEVHVLDDRLIISNDNYLEIGKEFFNTYKRIRLQIERENFVFVRNIYLINK